MKGKFGDFAVEMIAAAIFFVFKDVIIAVFDSFFGDIIRGVLGVRKEEGK